MKAEVVTLSAPRPFSLKATALSHGWHECAPMSWSEGGSCLQIIERDGDRAYRISVTEGRKSARSVSLNVRIEGGPLTEAGVARSLENLRMAMGLDQDLGEFFAICREHPTLRVLESIGAGRSIRSVSMAENVVKTICGSNVNWTQAVKMINRLGQLGPSVPHFRSLNAWPTPREILRAGEKYLLEVCRVGYRAEAILKFCEDVVEKRFDPDELDVMARDPNVTTEEISSRLKSIRGVGPTSANYLLSFLGRHDRLSIDTSTVAHVARTHTNGRKPTIKKIEKIYAKYGPWKNKVWWFEHWLNWGTARRILEESAVAGVPRSNGRARRPRRVQPV
jgi:3-methyladenine DNA glycosylase/8-oxoguanine DNA glycosylase